MKEDGIADITLVVGYKAEMFAYLCDKYGVDIVLNEDYARYNNTSSLIRVIDKLDNTFVCSSDNYFSENVFMNDSDDSYYSALYAEGETNEYCLTTDADDYITDVRVGGRDAWYMVGHVFFNREFSEAFRNIMTEEYKNDTTRKGYWEDLYIRYIDQLPKMKINRYKEGEIQEFDSLDESAEVMYEKAMRIPDDVLMDYFKLTTDLDLNEIEKIMKEDVVEAHKIYAREIIKM